MFDKPSRQTLKEYGRGVVGGLIFSLPLLYTMEVWWTGFSAPPGYLLIYVGATYLLLLGYNTYAGMRKDVSFLDVCWDSIEEIGLAFMVSFFFLLLISKISFGMSLDEIAGKVIVESMIMAIGISVGTAQLGQKGNDSGMQGDQEENKKKNDSFLKMVVLSLCGAVLFSSSVAPTEEILKIGIQSEKIHLLIMVFLSLLLSAVILYFSSFRGSKTSEESFTKMLFYLILCYVMALFVALMFLWFFGRVAGFSFQIVVAQMIVLAIPGSIGASAGRLLISGQ